MKTGKEMKKIIAVGPRQQDFMFTNDFFYGSVTLFGENKGKNISYCGQKSRRINHNIVSTEQEEFIDQELLKAIKEDPDIQFMSYDPNLAYTCDAEVIKRTVCLNSKDIMDKMNNKITFREWANKISSTFHSELLQGSVCTFEKLCSRLGITEDFVVQEVYATGGEGTLLLNADNKNQTQTLISDNSYYLVSKYERENIPLNIHAIIYEEKVVLFPVSIQIMQRNENKLLFHGSDYMAVNQIDKEVLDKFIDATNRIFEQLRIEGFRGVTGIDGIIVDDNAYVLEMNNRFQGSTLLLNLALSDAGKPSMQEMNYESFNTPSPQHDIGDLEVPYSMFVYLADEKGRIPNGYERNFLKESSVYKCFSDGLDYSLPIAPFATLERVVFNKNIVSINPYSSISLHPNITNMDSLWVKKILEKDLLYIKIALINQGAIISDEARDYLSENGGMRDGVYYAIDIYLDSIVINCPLGVNYVQLSPFSIRCEDEELFLYLFDSRISYIEIAKYDELQSQVTPNGVKVSDICLLATDRVRVQHSPNCNFMRLNCGCDYCEVENYEFSFLPQDVFDAIDMYIDSKYAFRHFLIGGRTGRPYEEPKEILEIVRYIRSRGDWPIYVMCVPPKDLKTLDDFYNAGVTEMALNIEIWDEKLAKKWMPGKRSTSRAKYLEALSYATTLWGKTGNIRTAFIVGLEKKETLLEGIEETCRAGVAPLLSVFRPIPGTFGNRIVPLTNDELLDIYFQAQKICFVYGLKLGPDCVECQNNTLSLPNSFLEYLNYE